MKQYFFAKSAGRYVRISFHEIIYVEGCKNYVKIVTETKVHLVLFTMKAIEKFLPSDPFKRIHKSFIISVDKIAGFDTHRVYLPESASVEKTRVLPIGHQYRGVLEKTVLIAEGRGEEMEFQQQIIRPVTTQINGKKRQPCKIQC